MFLFRACHWHCVSLSLSAWSLVVLFFITNLTEHFVGVAQSKALVLPTFIYARNSRLTSFDRQKDSDKTLKEMP